MAASSTPSFGGDKDTQAQWSYQQALDAAYAADGLLPPGRGYRTGTRHMDPWGGRGHSAQPPPPPKDAEHGWVEDTGPVAEQPAPTEAVDGVPSDTASLAWHEALAMNRPLIHAIDDSHRLRAHMKLLSNEVSSCVRYRLAFGTDGWVSDKDITAHCLLPVSKAELHCILLSDDRLPMDDRMFKYKVCRVIDAQGRVQEERFMLKALPVKARCKDEPFMHASVEAAARA